MGGNAVLRSNKLIRIYVCVNVRVTNAQIFTLFSWTRWTDLGTLTMSDPINGNLVLQVLAFIDCGKKVRLPGVKDQRCKDNDIVLRGSAKLWWTIYWIHVGWRSPERCIKTWQVSLQHHTELESRLNSSAPELILPFLCVLTNKLFRGETGEGRQVGCEVVNLPLKWQKGNLGVLETGVQTARGPRWLILPIQLYQPVRNMEPRLDVSAKWFHFMEKIIRR